ncbi:DUF262 domain-containing protein [Candidatus Saccharibacteria bacterium]|nr:DUF262 domain-containing protein [Candidatus Saccharibacteria bacterium]
MEMNKKSWSIASTANMQKRIDTNPDYQRPAVWGTSQKQLLIDTILKGYDIPKLYLRKVASNPDKYEVVDGQQRLRAIWGFINEEYALASDAENLNGEKIAGLKYNQLSDDIRLDRFDSYNLDVVVITESDEEEVREMFLRLQNGTSLKAQEKRNAMPGKMRNFIKTLVNHKFFEKVNFNNARFAHDHIAAQMCLLEIKGEICNIKNNDLNKLYKDYRDFDENSREAKKIKRVLDYLLKVFPEKTPELERYSVISLYILVSTLIDKYVIKDKVEPIREWFINFEVRRRELAKRSLDDPEVTPEFLTYQEKIKTTSDSFDSLNYRHEYLINSLFETIPNLETKDKQREFDRAQKMAIYRRDKGCCQLKLRCNGKKCEWDNWHADHIIPWSKGGKTIVENGQVACPECNLAKGADE